jgi:hypothetical protein
LPDFQTRSIDLPRRPAKTVAGADALQVSADFIASAVAAKLER